MAHSKEVEDTYLWNYELGIELASIRMEGGITVLNKIYKKILIIFILFYKNFAMNY